MHDADPGSTPTLQELPEDHRGAQFQRLLAGVRAIVWECDAVTWEFSYISEGVEEILGYPVEDWYGDAELWAGTIHPEDRARVVDTCVAGIEARRDSTIEYRAIARNGDIVWLRDIIHVVTDEEGAAVRLQGVMIDITEEKTLEEQLRQAQKMEAVGRLAGGIAHDFNNVLTAIQGHTQLLLEGLDEDDPLRADAVEIGRSADHAASLTRQLLAFSRRQLVRPEVLDVNELVDRLRGMLGRLLEEDVVLDTSLAPDLEPVKADPSQLEQVVLNLAVNARDALPDGGRIRIATEIETLSAGDASLLPFPIEPGRYVVLSVSDTGEGMGAAVQARVFEPFFTTKVVGRGTGLGLSTVYGIVKKAEGFIHVDSEVGTGTTFKVFLPPVEREASGADGAGSEASEASGAESESEASGAESEANGADSEASGWNGPGSSEESDGNGPGSEAAGKAGSEPPGEPGPETREGAQARASRETDPAGEHETIVVVEDEDAVRSVVCKVLQRQGYRVLQAGNGVEAERLIQEHVGPIDLVITDVVMPEMDGRALAERISRFLPEVPVLFMSGYTEDVLMHRGIAEGQTHFLEKPFAPETLVQRVPEVLACAREQLRT